MGFGLASIVGKDLLLMVGPPFSRCTGRAARRPTGGDLSVQCAAHADPRSDLHVVMAAPGIPSLADARG